MVAFQLSTLFVANELLLSCKDYLDKMPPIKIAQSLFFFFSPSELKTVALFAVSFIM